MEKLRLGKGKWVDLGWGYSLAVEYWVQSSALEKKEESKQEEREESGGENETEKERQRETEREREEKWLGRTGPGTKVSCSIFKIFHFSELMFFLNVPGCPASP
jgi:hypothetical protein